MGQIEASGRDDHDRDVACDDLSGNLGLDGQPIDARESQVEHDEVGRMLLEQNKRLVAVAGFTNIEPRRREDPAEHRA
ncbi:MAG TPA: hypothetical protein VEL79_22995 [Vicinamibacterales bacterium]|nr:hypothetical protein [Vicinamibacterales bacterium]